MDLPNGYHETSIQPEINEWYDLTRMNRESADATLTIMSPDAKQRLRESVVQAARHFTEALDDRVCEEAWRPPRDRKTKEDKDSLSHATPIIMTGHQPTVFHPGIAFKYELTARFAKSIGAIAIAVIIDTDSGDGGEMNFPVTVADELRQERVSLGDGTGLFLSQQLADEPTIRRLGAQASESLRELGFAAEGDSVVEAIDRYARLPGCSIVEANAMVRRSFGVATECLEIPLSTILTLPLSQSFFAAIFADAPRFKEVYNDTLSAHRASRKIRNRANPFPDLRDYDEGVELPFWVINLTSGERAPLFVEQVGERLRLSTRYGLLCETPRADIAAYAACIGGAHLIAPRGPIITALLRLALSDLFVHGTGGGKYDRFTDEFIRAYWSIEAPGFTVASATRYLFEQHRQEARQLKKLQRELREMISHTQRYLDNGRFSSDVELELRNMVSERTPLIESLIQAKRLRQPVADIARHIKQLDRGIESVVRRSFTTCIVRLQELTPDRLRAYDMREHPYIFFPTMLGPSREIEFARTV